MESKEFNLGCALAFLGHIQMIIRNMTFLSCFMKLASVLFFCLFITRISSEYSVVNCFFTAPLFVFWGLDAYFLRIERLYRILYAEESSEVRHGNFCVADTSRKYFDMNVCRNIRSEQSVMSALFSKTVLWYHVPIILIPLFLFLY